MDTGEAAEAITDGVENPEYEEPVKEAQETSQELYKVLDEAAKAEEAPDTTKLNEHFDALKKSENPVFRAFGVLAEGVFKLLDISKEEVEQKKQNVEATSRHISGEIDGLDAEKLQSYTNECTLPEIDTDQTVNSLRENLNSSIRANAGTFSLADVDTVGKDFTQLHNETAKVLIKGTKFPELDERKKSALKKFIDTSDGAPDLNDDEAKAVKEAFDEANKFVDENYDSLRDIDEKTNEDKGNADKPKDSKETWKKVMKILFLLEVAGGIAATLYLLMAYASAHSGCMKIEKTDDNSDLTQEKVYCSGNTADNSKTYGAESCYCKADVDYQTDSGAPLGCPRTGPDVDKYRPGHSDDGSRICIGDLGSGKLLKTYRYYSYQIMTPFGAALDIIDKGVSSVDDGIGKLIKILIHAAIVIGIIVGILAVLFIIYKVLSKKGEASTETVKVVAQSAAPAAQSVAKFGKYLGNLSKYSNYGLRGHCGTYRLIPK